MPLALLIRSTTADQAVSSAAGRASALTSVVATSDTETVELALAAAQANTDQPFTVFYPDGTSAGASAERSAAVELAATRGESLVAQAEGGRVVLVAVGLAEGTAVIQTFVAATELTDGVVRTWLVLAALGACLVVLGVLVADRLARNLVRPVVEASQVSHRLAAVIWTPEPSPVVRMRSARWPPVSTTSLTASEACCARNANPWRTCPTGSDTVDRPPARGRGAAGR